MQRYDFETQIPQARVLTEEELLQAQGGNFLTDALKKAWGPIRDPFPTGGAIDKLIHRIWEAVKQAA